MTERIAGILDASSFVELQGGMEDAHIITGYGCVDGLLVFIFAQTGYVTEAHVKKLGLLYERAVTMGAPVIGLYDSDGLKVEDGIEIMDRYARIMRLQTRAKALIPQIAAVYGGCMGISALMAQNSDIVLGVKDSQMFLRSPQSAKQGQTIPHAPAILYNDDNELNNHIRKFVTLLPSNAAELSAQASVTDDLNRMIGIQSTEGGNEAAVISLITELADNNDLLVTGTDGVVTGLIRLNGYTVGVLANNGKLNAYAMKSTVAFIRLCDRFSIRLLTITDCEGFDGTLAEESELLSEASALLQTISDAHMPKINIITGAAIGPVYNVMGCARGYADVVYAWENAVIAPMLPEAARRIMNIETEASPLCAAKRGLIDDVLNPATTRQYVIAAFEMLQTKSRAGRR